MADAHYEKLWVVAERARARGPLSHDDIAFVRDTLPAALDSFLGSRCRRRSATRVGSLSRARPSAHSSEARS